MFKDYNIIKCDYIKGYRWLVLKRISKNLKMQVAGGLTKKECEEWIRKKVNADKRKVHKQRIIKNSRRTK